MEDRKERKSEAGGGEGGRGASVIQDVDKATVCIAVINLALHSLLEQVQLQLSQG